MRVAKCYVLLAFAAVFLQFCGQVLGDPIEKKSDQQQAEEAAAQPTEKPPGPAQPNAQGTAVIKKNRQIGEGHDQDTKFGLRDKMELREEKKRAQRRQLTFSQNANEDAERQAGAVAGHQRSPVISRKPNVISNVANNEGADEIKEKGLDLLSSRYKTKE